MNRLAVKMPIVATVHFRTNVPVIQEQLEILTKYVDLKERHHAVKHHVELALNVVKMAYLLIVCAHLVISEIHSFSVMTSMNVRTELAVKEQFVSIHQEATIVNANQDRLGKFISVLSFYLYVWLQLSILLPEIHSLFVRLCKRMLATILSVASAMQIHYVHPVIDVKKESAEIYVKRLRAVQEPVAIPENVYVLLDILVHLTI